MPFLHDDILDNGLSELASADTLHYCSAEPATFAGVATVSLGSKSSPTVSTPDAGDPSGRKVTISSVADSVATGSGTITHWALVDTATSRLLAAAPVDQDMDVVTADTITSDAFDIRIPGPAA